MPVIATVSDVFGAAGPRFKSVVGRWDFPAPQLKQERLQSTASLLYEEYRPELEPDFSFLSYASILVS